PGLGHYVSFENLGAIPVLWLEKGAAPQDHVLPFRIGLKPQNFQLFEQPSYEISDPTHPSYRKFMTAEAIDALLDPSQQSVDLVHSWLNVLGINPVHDHRWITFNLTVSQAEILLQAKYNVYDHSVSNKTIIATLSCSIPSALLDIIEVIMPTTYFDLGLEPSMTPVTIKKRDDSTCTEATTPRCITQLYGIPPDRATHSSNVFAVAGFLNEYANRNDLKLFLDNYCQDLVDATFNDVSVSNGQNLQDDGTAGKEANLDIQYTVGLANFAPVTFYSVGDSAFQGFTALLEEIKKDNKRPTVLSISYGYNENQLSATMADNLCRTFAELGTLGVSVIVSSGDGGVAGSGPDSCGMFVPTFPSSCPFVTSVGATTGYPTESGAGFSAGGFSRYFKRPQYQTSAVTDYLTKLGGTYGGRYERDGRAYPDVAAIGTNVRIYRNGQIESVNGTSASAPIFASVIALINDRLMSADGGKPLGFLNNLLYSEKGVQGLNDIVSGNNPGCDTDGFPAASEWDPVTGLGTPNFPRLLTAAQS
ncbi:MAG: family S53 protease-like protein, partial [Benniella sp.]